MIAILNQHFKVIKYEYNKNKSFRVSFKSLIAVVAINSIVSISNFNAFYTDIDTNINQYCVLGKLLGVATDMNLVGPYLSHSKLTGIRYDRLCRLESTFSFFLGGNLGKSP